MNVRFLLAGKLEGIGHFTRETLRRIVQRNPDIHFYFLFDRPFSEEFVFGTNVTPVVLPPPARHPVLWWLWFQHAVAPWLRANRPDVFLSPDGFGCLADGLPPQVPVIHDLAFEHYPEHVPWLVRKYYRSYFPRYARQASRIVTVSDYTKNDLVSRYVIAPSRVDVVYNGAGDGFRPIDAAQAQAVRRRLSEGRDFFLALGSIHPRKNLPRVLRAFDAYRRMTGHPVKLLVAGARAWGNADLDRTLAGMRFGSEVAFTGYLPDSELQLLLPAARALVYASLFEGFGIPIVEAWRCDVPVITSNTSSMAEISGDAAILVDPTDVTRIARAMLSVASDPTLRAALIEKGRRRRSPFTWDATAERLWTSIDATLTEVGR